MGCLLAAAWCRVRGAVPGPTCSPGAPHLKAFWSFVSPPLHREHLEGEAGEVGGLGAHLHLSLRDPEQPRQSGASFPFG